MLVRTAAACAALLAPLAFALPVAATHDGSGPHARATDDSCPAGQVPRAPFTDVPRDNAHRSAIDCVVWWEVAAGRGTREYAPGVDVSRGQMATFLRNLVLQSGGDLPTPTKDHFHDDDGTRHEASINALAEAGIVAGRGDGRYAPDAPVERGAMATFLVNAYEHRAARQLPAADDAFTDDDGTRHETSTNEAAAAGFAAGVGGSSYAPQRVVRRDAMASFLTRVLDLLVEDGLAQPPVATAGDVDPRFGDGGSTTVDFGAGYAEARAAALGPDGSLAVAGIAEGHTALTRLRPDGTLDTSFGDQGRVITRLKATSQAEAVVVLPDRRIVVAGWADGPQTGRDILVARYLPDGALDPSFDGDGLVVLPGQFGARAMEALPLADGRLAVGARVYRQETGHPEGVGSYIDEELTILVLLPDGSLDPAFYDRGVYKDKRNGSDLLDGMTQRPDGTIVVGGLARTGSQPFDAEVLLRAASPGGPTGEVGPFVTGEPEQTSGAFTRVGAIASQSDGAIVSVGGYLSDPGSPTSTALVRHEAGGALDRSFGVDGVVLVPAAPQSVANAVSIDGDDRIVTAGTATAEDGTGPTWVLTRSLRDGAADATFDEQGVVRSPLGTVANAVLLQGSELVVAGCDCPADRGDRGGRDDVPQGASDFVVARFFAEAPAR